MDILYGFALGLLVACIAVALAAWSVRPRRDSLDDEGERR
jgi:hypothetical protein